jgi:hypothetical protein
MYSHDKLRKWKEALYEMLHEETSQEVEDARVHGMHGRTHNDLQDFPADVNGEKLEEDKLMDIYKFVACVEEINNLPHQEQQKYSSLCQKYMMIA